mgnify:CR=1 FL=1
MLALVLSLALSQSLYPGVGRNNALSSTLEPALAARIWARTTGKPTTSPRAPFTATDFKPVQPRSVAQAMVDGSRELTKEQSKALVDGLNGGLDVFEQETRKNNVAHALAFLIGISMQVVNEREVSDAESQMLAQAINDELAAAPQFKKLTPKQKQLLYETSVVVGALIGGMAAEAAERGNAELKAQAKTMAQQALSVFQGQK